jgi:hypothetical protein
MRQIKRSVVVSLCALVLIFGALLSGCDSSTSPSTNPNPGNGTPSLPPAATGTPPGVFHFVPGTHWS